MKDLPYASISLNIAETTYVLSAMNMFINNAAPKYGASNDYVNFLTYLVSDCQGIWSDNSWDSYSELYESNLLSNESLVKRAGIDRDSYWTISIVDCDAVILAMQFFSNNIFEQESTDYNQELINKVLLPRFMSMFTTEEWTEYNKEIDIY